MGDPHARRDLAARSVALVIKCPIDSALVTSAVTAEQNEGPNQAHFVDLETARAAKMLAKSEEIPAYARVCARYTGVAVRAHTIRRRAEGHRLRVQWRVGWLYSGPANRIAGRGFLLQIEYQEGVIF